MTTIDPRTLKPGDRIRYQREATVNGNFDGYLSLKSERGNGRPAEFRLEYEGRVPTTFELLERPVPAEPAPGTVVVFRPRTGRLTNGTAYQRFGQWWQTTRAGGPGRYSWADVLTLHPDDKFERITIGAPGA